MLLWTFITLVLTVCADLCIARGVFSVHNFRHVPINRQSATVRRVGNVYVFPYYSATRRKIYRCGYGAYKYGCCAGWMRNSVEGTCTPICEDGCVHGTCEAPNYCRCKPGYTGTNCNADLNECGLSPRPCNQRCINTHGSFRCHCEQGYLLEEDGRTCIRDSRCYPGRCAFGCRKSGYRLECICPAGLRLAEDGYHCLDIDECAEGTVRCPSDQRCVNTYGNFMCMCLEGYQFRYIDGKLQCTESEDRCTNQGFICDTNARCRDTEGGEARCVCNRGYVGNGIECTAVEIRTCSIRPCFSGVECTNTELESNDIAFPEGGVLNLYRCGDCPQGYVGDGETCEDVDECTTGASACHADARCINIPGSYRCQCNEGFTGSGFTCIPVGCDFPGSLVNGDINPPSTRRDGQYANGAMITFTCNTGYDLQGAALSECFRGMWTATLPTCADIDECQTGDAVCHEHATCTNTEGSYTCACKPGYTGNGKFCLEIQCEVPTPFENGMLVPPSDTGYANGDRVSFECNEGFVMVGPLISVCEQGMWSNEFPTCVDVDECSSGDHQCSVNADCINHAGGHTCRCRPGYHGNGETCLLIDATTCADLPCSPGVICTDLDREVVLASVDLVNPTQDVIRLYACGDCPSGYIGNGTHCDDVDECVENTHDCNVNARCVNIPGLHMCECNPGYYGDGRICIEIDDTTCSDRPCFPGAQCTDLNRAAVLGAVDLANPPDIIRLYECGDCPEGFQGDGKNCTDIDECALNLDECDENAECINLPGLYNCVCNRGFFGDGRVCIRVDPTRCADDPCFPGVVCEDLDRGEVVRDVDLSNPVDVLLQYTCGECPPGYRGDGVECTDIDECAEETFECHPNATCTNIPGDYDCSCNSGFFGDGKSCIRMDMRQCTPDAPCFPGVDCEDLSRPEVLAKVDLATASPEDIIKFYLCGDCPDGYLGDGEQCDDINECQSGDVDCHTNATCENEIGGYKCICTDGHLGNGTHCAQLDERMCADNPCFPGVECTDLDPMSVDFTQPFVRLFECGSCPEDYSGDGIECIKDYVPPFVNLTVIVVDHTDSVEEAPAPDTEVSAFMADQSAEWGTAKFASAFTGPDGIAVIPVPHNQTIIVTGAREGNLVNSQTFKASLKQRNVMTLPLAAFEELNVFLWRRISSNGFEFGDKQGGHSYRVEIPAGGLAVPERRRVTIEFYGVNQTIPESFEHAPEAIAAIPRASGARGDIELTNGESGTDLVPLEMVGVMELNVYRTDTFQPPRIRSPVRLTLPVQKLPAGLGEGDSLDAWYFDPDHGVWRKDGAGTIQMDNESGKLVWVYEARHFTWWAAGRAQAQPSCVRVRTCFDDDCIQPAPTVRVRLIGEDYGFVSSRTTDSKGEACFTFKHTGTVTLEAVCAMTRREVVSTTLPAVCEESDTDIPRRTLDLSLDVDSCQNVTLVLPLLAGNMTCPDPGDVMFSTNRIQTGDAYGDTVQYTCPIGLLPDPYEGYRACLECGLWSGRPVSCADTSQFK